MRLDSWLSLALLAMVAACGDSASQHTDANSCGDVAPRGCGNNAEFEVTYTGDETQLVEAKARVCRNTTCVDVPMPIVPAAMDVGYGETVYGPLGATVTVFRRAQIEIEAATFEDSAGLVDGDTYSLTIRARDASVLAEASWIASYTERWAASACGPACRHAQLTPMP